MLDNKRPATIAKVAAYASTLYQKVETALSATKPGYFFKWWLPTVQVRPRAHFPRAEGESSNVSASGAHAGEVRTCTRWA